ncbi:gamma-glutamyltransferase [Novosphingobium sp.]|uniref:gamma-glutamyltransferase n=1 Tax=Novosphingobium sp. TaxID=1874826 RepID=UPI0025E383D5|nr:gamma-glutamyltransferase [Novosphingobium sp.]
MTLRTHVALLALPVLSAFAVVPAALARPAATQVYTKGMVSAADPRAADAGAQMLRAGGNATDAAIATMLALSVVEPQSSGIGGGGFFVETGADGHVVTIDGREKAPASASDQWFVRDGKVMSFSDAVPGAISVGVPGNVALAAKAHKAHGKLPWARLFAPAINLARHGFAITPRLNAALKNSAATAAFTPAGKALFYDASGQPKAVGTRVINAEMAATLMAIAARGPRAFYSGPNSTSLVTALVTAARNPAPVTKEDVAAYAAQNREPVCGNYRLYRICGMGPPSSGATTVFATLKQLERFDLTALGKDSPVAWHLIAESMRLAYADRARYSGDADFVRVPVAGLTDPDYLSQRSALISPEKTMPAVSAGMPRGAESLVLADPAPQEEHGTSHFVAADRRGNVVTYTSTIESAFGSGLMTGGYFLNNELTDFDMNPVFGGKPANNRVQGGKRPRSSMSPTLVFGPDGAMRLAVGAAGGATIPAQVIRAVIGVLDWKLSAQDALALPVLFAPGGDAVYVEQGSAAEAMVPALTALGHASVTARALPLKANAIEMVGGVLIGAADPRSEGKAVSE